MIGKSKFCFDPTLADLDENDNVGSYIRAKDGDITEGGDNDSDNVATTIESLNTRSFLYGYDSVGDNWDRLKTTDGSLHVLADLDVEFDYVYPEDSGHTTADPGAFVLAVRQDTLANSTDADGDYAAFKVNTKGELYIHDTDMLAKATEIDAVLDTIYTEQLDQGTTLDSIDGKITTCNNRIKVTDAAEGTLKTTAVVAGTTQAALVTTPLANREFLYIQNRDPRPVFIAEAGAADASATGIELPCGAVAEFRFGAAAALDIKGTQASQDVRVLEAAC